MRINRSLAIVSLLTILSACASQPRPDVDATPMSRSGVSAPIDVSLEPAEQTLVPPAPVDEAADIAVSEPPIVQAAPVASTPEHASSAPPISKPLPAFAPKVVKPVEATVDRSAAAAPRPPFVPPVLDKPSETAVAEVSEKPPVTNAGGNRIHGKLELIAGSGQSLSDEEMRQAVVYFVPDSPINKAKPGHFRIYTHNKEFEPASLVIPLNSTISFPNQDEILHNVFSVTPRSSFDLGTYGEGKSADYTFKKTGLVLINCNVHQAMQANVLIVDTSYIAHPDQQGRFALDNLPVGSGKLAVWHPRANVEEQLATVPLKASVSLRLVLSKPRITEHLNKERKAYR